jgi:oxygen-independent coproporphyrinogen-3 oxidase
MSLYIHIPFCRTKCPYCDFNTYQGIESLTSTFLDALTTELRLWGRVLDHPRVNTIFLGGGTPSYLPAGAIKRILEAARSAFQLQADAEVTAEANPDDLDQETCGSLLEQGINRLSIGVQSLDNGLLGMLGRRHDARQAIDAFARAKQAGFSNINLDLMYGLPQQTLAHWQDTVAQLLSLNPAHISLYCLTLEEGTPLHQWVEQGKLPQPDADLAADMYHLAEDLLEQPGDPQAGDGQSGYQHYEISNWSRPGLACRHNLCYWENQPYLGVGPGAHSCLSRYRFWDTSAPRLYISQVEAWEYAEPQPITSLDQQALEHIRPVGGYEYIDPDLAAAETMFLGLRLLDGMDLPQASSQAGTDLGERYRAEIDECQELGLLEWSGPRLRLTKPTYLIANQVFTRFLG